MIKQYTNITRRLNLNLQHRRTTFHLTTSNNTILEKMYQLNLIRNVDKKSSRTVVKVNDGLFNTVKIHPYNHTHSKIYLSKHQILKKRLHLGATIYLFSTPVGILTQHEVIKKNSSGFLLGKITLI